MTASRTTRLLTFLVLAACGTDEDPGAPGSALDAGADASSNASADAGQNANDAGTSTDAGDATAPKPPPGTLFGTCVDGGCDPGLFCITHGETTMDGGVLKGCQVQVCTQGCDAGCPSPSPGCGAFNRCHPPSCL